MWGYASGGCMTEQTAQEVADAVLTQMYAEANPGLDWQWAQDNPDEMDDDWYTNYYLDGERQHEILDSHLDEAELSDRDETAVKLSVLLDYAPTSDPSDVEGIDE